MICLIIGHKQSSPGARDPITGVTEYDFNKKLATDIISRTDLEIQVVYREQYKGLPDKVNSLNPDFSVSLHLNAFNRKARGTEMLYYHTSQLGKEIATTFQFLVVDALGTKDRPLQSKTSEDRGGYLLRYTDHPCIIAETFFIDSELADIECKYDALVDAYVDGFDLCAKLF